MEAVLEGGTPGGLGAGRAGRGGACNIRAWEHGGRRGLIDNNQKK